MKSSLITVSVLFCSAAALFSFWAANCIQHNPGWEMVQGGVLFMGICYALGAIAILHTFTGKA